MQYTPQPLLTDGYFTWRPVNANDLSERDIIMEVKQAWCVLHFSCAGRTRKLAADGCVHYTPGYTVQYNILFAGATAFSHQTDAARALVGYQTSVCLGRRCKQASLAACMMRSTIHTENGVQYKCWYDCMGRWLEHISEWLANRQSLHCSGLKLRLDFCHEYLRTSLPCCKCGRQQPLPCAYLYIFHSQSSKGLIGSFIISSCFAVARDQPCSLWFSII